MDKNWNNGSNSDEKLSNIGFESLSLGQKLLSKCLKKTGASPLTPLGISVSVRGIAVNTTSQIKTAGSAWKSEAKYDPATDANTGTLDDVSFPDLLGSSNRETSVNRPSEVSSVTNDTDRVAKESRRTKYKIKHRIASVQAVNSPAYHTVPDPHLGDAFKDMKDDDLLGSDFLMPGMKGNHPLGFTNFIGKGVRHPPPPPPPLPYPDSSQNIFANYCNFHLSRSRNAPMRTHVKPVHHLHVPSPQRSDSNWHDNKSEGYNEAELTTAIDSLNHSILADRGSEEALSIKPFMTEKMSRPYLDDLSNFDDNPLLLQEPLGNQLDERLVDQLENRMSTHVDDTLSRQIDPPLHDSLEASASVHPERRRRDRYIRRRRFTDQPPSSASITTNVSAGSNSSGRAPKEAPEPPEPREAHLTSEPREAARDDREERDAPHEASRDEPRPPFRESPGGVGYSARSNPPPVEPLNLPPEPDNPPVSSAPSRPERDQGRPRRPRHRPRGPRREPDFDNWRNTSNASDQKQEVAPDSDRNPPERKHFRPRGRYRPQGPSYADAN